MQATRSGKRLSPRQGDSFVADGRSLRACACNCAAPRAGRQGKLQDLPCLIIDANPPRGLTCAFVHIDSRDHARLGFRRRRGHGDDLSVILDNGLAALRPGLEAGQAPLPLNLTGLQRRPAITLDVSWKERKQFDRTSAAFQPVHISRRTNFPFLVWSEIEVTSSAIANCRCVVLDHTPADAALQSRSARHRAGSTQKLGRSRSRAKCIGGIGAWDRCPMHIGFS